MLFYEQMSPERQSGCDTDQTAGSGDEQKAVAERKVECSEPCKFNVELSKELADVSRSLLSDLIAEYCCMLFVILRIRSLDSTYACVVSMAQTYMCGKPQEIF